MIHKHFTLLVLVAIISAFSSGCKKDVIETTTVASSRGLVLRKSPDAAAEKILVIPHKASVGILTYSNTMAVIDGKTAPWVEVRYGEKEGWVFSAYLANYVSQGYGDISKIGSFSDSPFKKRIFPATIGSNIKASIVKNFPVKTDVQSIEKENRHDPTIKDMHHTITSSGMTVTIYEAVKLKKEILEAIVITENVLPLKYNISIGMAAADVENIFGPPSEKKENEITYFTSDAIPVTVIFSFGNDKLKKIILAYPVE